MAAVMHLLERPKRSSVRSGAAGIQYPGAVDVHVGARLDDDAASSAARVGGSSARSEGGEVVGGGGEQVGEDINAADLKSHNQNMRKLKKNTVK
jgi:hypothetical protein